MWMKRGLGLRGFSVRRSLPPGFFKGFMTRKQRREELRAQRKQIDLVRRQGNVCPHGEDRRIYSSEAEADADKSQNLICGICGKPQLRLVFYPRRPTLNAQGVTTNPVTASDIEKFMR